MARHHKTSHPVKLTAPKGGKGIWNATPAKGVSQTNTFNGSRAPVRAGMGAVRSKEWYARND